MSTFMEIIARVDESKPNQISEMVKLKWLTALNGKIAADVFLMGIEEIRALPHKGPEALEAEPLVGYPHEDLYDAYLEAKIDYANGDYSDYQNCMESYNEYYSNFRLWFANVYDPVQRKPRDFPQYYITAYGLAIMKGFNGTLEEWLESLHGMKGDPGKTAYQYAIEAGYTGTEDAFGKWLIRNGKTAYEYAVEAGYKGSEEDFALKMAAEYAPKDHSHGAPYNLLDNSNFRNPINQRGKASYSDYGYTIDRWRASAGACSVSAANAGITLKNTNVPSDNEVYFLQYLEDGKITAEKLYTLAIMLDDGTVHVCCCSALASPGVGKKYQISNIGFMYLARNNGGRHSFEIGVYGGQTMTVVWAALYEGEFTAETLPEYCLKGYLAELQECQRYYVKFAKYTTTGLLTSAAKKYYMPIYLAGPMRICPSVGGSPTWRGTLAAGGISVCSGGSFIDFNAPSVSFDGASSNTLLVIDTISDAVDPNNSVLFFEIVDLELSADL